MKKTRKFKVLELAGEKIVVQSKELEKFDVKDFIVFRSKELLPDDSIKSFMETINKLNPKRKAILLPPFIQVCEFVEELDESPKSKKE